jgi:hypothetical protein
MNLSISFLLNNNSNGMSLQSLNNNWQIFTFLVMPLTCWYVIITIKARFAI